MKMSKKKNEKKEKDVQNSKSGPKIKIKNVKQRNIKNKNEIIKSHIQKYENTKQFFQSKKYFKIKKCFNSYIFSKNVEKYPIMNETVQK